MTRIDKLKACLVTDHMPDIFVMSAFLTLLQNATIIASLKDYTVAELIDALAQLRQERVEATKAALKARIV